MSNLLEPPGLIPKKSYCTRHYLGAPDSRTEPMPPKIGRLIKTEHGIRRLMKKELAKGLGADSLAEHTRDFLVDEVVDNQRRPLGRLSTKEHHDTTHVNARGEN